MLVLSRKLNEGIHIGKDIRVMVVEIRKNGLVRLGIEAPREVEVHRDEIFEKRKRNGENDRNDQHVA